MKVEQTLSPDLIERIGIVIWKIAVLLIGLRGILALVPQQGLVDGLAIGSSWLQASALVLTVAGGVWALIRAARVQLPWSTGRGLVGGSPRMKRDTHGAHASRWQSAAQSAQHMMWRGSNWMLALGLESLLAAQIIQVSIAYAGQNDLNWWRMIVLVIIAISRILL